MLYLQQIISLKSSVLCCIETYIVLFYNSLGLKQLIFAPVNCDSTCMTFYILQIFSVYYHFFNYHWTSDGFDIFVKYGM